MSFQSRPRGISCPMCGGQFFKASLKFHQKACAEKNAFVALPCPYCDVPFPRMDLERHVRNCTSKPKELARAPAPGAFSGETGYKTMAAPRSVTGGVGGGRGGASVAFEEFSADTGMSRVPCAVCGRKFAPDRVAKHQSICRSVASKSAKRGVFDTQSRRLAAAMDDGSFSSFGGGGGFGGTSKFSRSLASKSRSGGGGGSGAVGRSRSSGDGALKSSKWRQQHLEFQAMLRSARGGGRGAPKGGRGVRFVGASDPSSGYSSTPSYSSSLLTPCPHCNRRFNEDVAAKHIPKCRDTIARPRPPPSHARSSSGGTRMASSGYGYGSVSMGGDSDDWASGSGITASHALSARRSASDRLPLITSPGRSHTMGSSSSRHVVDPRGRPSTSTSGSGGSSMPAGIRPPVTYVVSEGSRSRAGDVTVGIGVASSSRRMHTSSGRRPADSHSHSHRSSGHFGGGGFGSSDPYLGASGFRNTMSSAPGRGFGGGGGGGGCGGGGGGGLSISTSNQTSLGNPLATSHYQVMEHPVVQRGRR